MDEQSKRKRPTYSDESKQDAVQLVVDECYSIRAASQAAVVDRIALPAHDCSLPPRDGRVSHPPLSLSRFRSVQVKRDATA